jgi:hypothetical protein
MAGKFRCYIAEQDEDSHCYNIIARTKKELIKKMEESSHVTFFSAAYVELIYNDMFDMVDILTGEGGGRDIGSFFQVIRSYDTPLTDNHVPEED